MLSGDHERDSHAQALEWEFAWLEQVIRLRIHELSDSPWEPPPPPPALPPASGLAGLHARGGFGDDDRLVLALASAPSLEPQLLDPLLLVNAALGRRFTEFGGWVAPETGHLIPTRQTVLFLLGGGRMAHRLAAEAALLDEAPAMRAGVRLRGQGDATEGAGLLQADPLLLERVVGGRPIAGAGWRRTPAQRLVTSRDWDELELEAGARAEVEHLLAWARHRLTLERRWGLGRYLNPGYRALFYGPPGSGKTLTAALVGKVLQLPVLRIDLSQLVSKYIGETEKNLAQAFDEASADAVLFFDEADSLFGRRVEARTATDRAANQEVGFLLQRIEEHPGLVILASNLRGALDPAFTRRFQSIVYFALPEPATRLRLWRAALEGKPFGLASDVDLEGLAQAHALSGADIMNVMQFVSVLAADRGAAVTQADLLRGVRRELQKSGRPLG